MYNKEEFCETGVSDICYEGRYQKNGNQGEYLAYRARSITLSDALLYYRKVDFVRFFFVYILLRNRQSDYEK